MRITKDYCAFILACIGLCAAVFAAGCGTHEELVRTGMLYERPSPEAPDWARGRMPHDEDYIYFVGRGVAYNVLDERAAYDAARDHVMEQVARQIATRVMYRTEREDHRGSRVCEGDSAGACGGCVCSGAWPWARSEGMSAAAEAEAWIATNALVGDLEDREIFWEEWTVNDRPSRWCSEKRGMKRYKCWVLMSIPRDAFNARVASTMRILETEAQRRLVLAKADADLNILRAEQDMKLHVIAAIAEAESDRLSPAGSDVVFNVVDNHRHRMSSGKNYNRQDTIRLLNAARIRRATGLDMYSPTEAKQFLDNPDTDDVVYDLLGGGPPRAGG